MDPGRGNGRSDVPGPIHPMLNRLRDGGDDENGDDGRLIGVALTDRLTDGLSMVYSFFEPDEVARSLGRFMVLDHVALARDLELSYVYLGYWVEGSPKMHYKSRFQPMEQLTSNGWRRMAPEGR